MTARLTEEEIAKIREDAWECGTGVSPSAIDRLLDELLEHRAREASIRKYWLDCHDAFMKECRLTAEQPNDMLRDVKWEPADGPANLDIRTPLPELGGKAVKP